MASTLNRRLYRALLLGREARALATHDATVRVDELFQEIDVFVVDVADVILCKDICHRLYVYTIF